MRTVKTNNPGDLLISAMRYALGRQTYIVESTVNDLILNWNVLSDNEKSVIVREVKQAIKRGQAGMQMDVKQWQELLKLAGVSK